LSAWVNCMYDADEIKTANDILLSKKITFRF
jgi:hypothetical protein